MLKRLEEEVSAGGSIDRNNALSLARLSGPAIFSLFGAANNIRSRFRGTAIDLCSIISAKSGSCGEDCAFCAQSAVSSAEINRFPLVEISRTLEAAEAARCGGSRRFCIVTSGRRVSKREIDIICTMVAGVRALGLLPCATLGLLDAGDLRSLREAGLERYHNNLETSERYFPTICTTHTWLEKVSTLTAASAAGLSVCSGGIFGLGETWEDRIDLAFALKELAPDSVPINFLTPVRGTRLQAAVPLEPMEALKIISIYRFILPDKEIRVCGGRIQTLGQMNSLIFFAGADGLLTGNYLTTLGRDYGDDLTLISQCGLSVKT